MHRRLVCALASSVALTLSFSAPSSAADRGFCRDYAHAALNQVRGAMNNGRCEDRVRGARWSTDWRTHYDWCRGVSRDQAEDEREARRRTLEHCAG